MNNRGCIRGYTPINLGSICNEGIEFVTDNRAPAIGDQIFYGLPFRIATNSHSCFIGFNDNLDQDPVTVPIDNKAYSLIFVHRLLDREVNIGEIIADYIVQYTCGERVYLPIREYFEIGAGSEKWGYRPYLAKQSAMFELLPARCGNWNMMGLRQTGFISPLEFDYYIWDWINPSPQKEISHLTIVPYKRKFIIAAVTLGGCDERPLSPEPGQFIKISLVNPIKVGKDLPPINCKIDRGIAGYCYPVLEQATATYFQNNLSGWGDSNSTTLDQVYFEVAAISSAKLSIYNRSEMLISFLLEKLKNNFQLQTNKVRVEILNYPKNWVFIKVVDDDTGSQLPCRIHFRSKDGIPFPPYGHPSQVNDGINSWHQDLGGDVRLGQISYAYIDGTCQGWLPRDDVVVDVACGYEYHPKREIINIKPEQQYLELRMKRWINMNQKGWYSGDSHVHFLGMQAARFEALAEGVNVVNLLQSQWGNLYTNIEDFTGLPEAKVENKVIVYCSQENREYVLGHITLWGLKKTVMPWCTGGPTEASLGKTLEESLSGWADAAHAQGGTVILPHFPYPFGESATLIATGRADAIEMVTQDQRQHEEYYAYLNAGYRLPLVGGTDKMDSNVPIGLCRTYALLASSQPFDYDHWRAAVTGGRTFVTTGPLLFFTVDGYQPGEVLKLKSKGSVNIVAQVHSIFPIHTLQIVQNGMVVAETQDANGVKELSLQTSLIIDSNSWLAARCGGHSYNPTLTHNDVWKRGIFAHTSPIYVGLGDNEWSRFDQKTVEHMLTLIEGGIAYINQRLSILPNAPIMYHHGRPNHKAYLEKPFLEARNKVISRLKNKA